MQGMIAVMVFNALRQLISEQISDIRIDDFQSGCMGLVGCSHGKTYQILYTGEFIERQCQIRDTIQSKNSEPFQAR
jgi:hypothetical protein